MEKIDPEEYRKRLDTLSEILTNISLRADEISRSRCPYKNRFSQCTASFGCRNKRKATDPAATLPNCGGDDKLDYRSAWETIAAANRRTLFDQADSQQMAVPSSCGRQGTCHECVVEVRQGMESLCARTAQESFLRGNYRLACQAAIENTAVRIDFRPLQRKARILTASAQHDTELDPCVTRIGESVFYNGAPIDEYRGHLIGLAIDLGTTTIVIEFVDLETGEVRFVSSIENPQRFGGSDVMNRISYDLKHRGELHSSVIHALNNEITAACSELGIVRQEIYEVLVAGNTTMRDLFFGLDVQPIGQRPYKSQIEEEFRQSKRDTTVITEFAHRLGILTHPKARIIGGPLIASHVGADTAAALLATGCIDQQDTVMLVDVGTNTEVVVGHKGRWVAASCPAGPAFEGGLIRYGMTGCDGAIEALELHGDSWRFRTIGNQSPQGICGSGLIDLLAELRRNALMTPKGVFPNRRMETMIVPEQGITLSREDASNLAQAKAANYCGQLILLRHLGLQPCDVGTLYLAGAFANHINVRNAVEIGFLAPVPEDRIRKVGNAAALGARQMLLSRRKRADIEQFVNRIEHVELETTPDFFDLFVEGCQFKPMEFN